MNHKVYFTFFDKPSAVLECKVNTRGITSALVKNFTTNYTSTQKLQPPKSILGDKI
ncbi:MAG: hypothetical protein RMJ67_04195 [Elusimicrobiota bacterium]|nr:hypothetical protein [Endomicrobiia bacterium]MDW8165693.1 hypothetical protein [Elusimicrobiota bacterium]